MRTIHHLARRLLLLACALLAIQPPGRAQEQERPPLPDYLAVSIPEVLKRGERYLRSAQLANGSWIAGEGTSVGYAALPALTLLELGAPAKDKQVQAAAALVRSWIPRIKAPALDNTYEVSLAILFLDRLGDPRDKENIEILTARLIAGQTHTGGWSYKVPILNEKDSDLILSLIRKLEPLPLQELLGGRLEGLDNPFVKNLPRKVEAGEPKKYAAAKIPKQLVDLPVMNDLKKFQEIKKLVDPPNEGQRPLFGTTDNSTTQFGLLALWAGRRHKIPASRTGTLAFMRYHTSQNSDGGWAYPYVHGGSGTTATMINPGLLGLAIGHGLVREMGLADDPPVDEDPRVHKGFAALVPHIGEPQGRIQDVPMPNLYFLWSLERVCVLYNVHLIGNKDWYRWGAEALIANQDPATGQWELPKGNYAGSEAATIGPINASFALLFLKRANLAQDLSAYLKFSPKKLNDSVVKLMPKQVAAPTPEPKVEAKPVQVAEAAPPKVAPPESKPAPAPTPVAAPPQPSPAPAPESGGSGWIWLLVGLGGLLLVGAVLAIVFLRGGAAEAEEEEEEERRPKKKPKRR